MTSMPIVTQLQHLGQVPWYRRAFVPNSRHLHRPDLQQLARQPALLPRFVRESAVAMRYVHLLGPLAWSSFPERQLMTNWGAPTIPYAPFVAACLVKLDQQFPYMSHLRGYLIEHPALVWVLGFPLVPSSRYSWGFDAEASLPTQRHFARLLSKTPNSPLQFLLSDTVHLLQAELATETECFGQVVSIDTKHILAWVKENNPKAYVKEGRYDKTKQPAGDPDCRLGCKRRRNQRTSREGQAPAKEPPPTPLDNPLPANTLSVGQYYWGYGSGIVATKVPGWGEFVLAELTQSFDHSDLSYFFPLCDDAERRLGFRPKFAAMDAAFDSFYVYEHFQQKGQDWPAGFAAVPFSQRGGHLKTFDDDGLPLCTAGLAMPLKSTYTSRRGLVPHEAGSYVCPLFYPVTTGKPCPVNHKQWAKSGCITKMATSIGARIRYQLDRDSDLFKEIYKQRTASERINSLAVELGIERPRLRNGQAIANQNTLIYVLINLRALHRIRRKKESRQEQLIP